MTALTSGAVSLLDVHPIKKASNVCSSLDTAANNANLPSFLLLHPRSRLTYRYVVIHCHKTGVRSLLEMVLSFCMFIPLNKQAVHNVHPSVVLDHQR